MNDEVRYKPWLGVLEELPLMQYHPAVQGPLGLLCPSLHHCPASHGRQELEFVDPWSGLYVPVVGVLVYK